jgi:hypothetical protein
MAPDQQPGSEERGVPGEKRSNGEQSPRRVVEGATPTTIATVRLVAEYSKPSFEDSDLRTYALARVGDTAEAGRGAAHGPVEYDETSALVQLAAEFARQANDHVQARLGPDARVEEVVAKRGQSVEIAFLIVTAYRGLASLKEIIGSLNWAVTGLRDVVARLLPGAAAVSGYIQEHQVAAPELGASPVTEPLPPFVRFLGPNQPLAVLVVFVLLTVLVVVLAAALVWAISEVPR